MKFYLIEISEGEQAIKGKAIYEYATLNESVANFHSKLGAAMKSNLFTSELVMVINSDGGIHKSEKYIADVSQPTEPEEPIEE